MELDRYFIVTVAFKDADLSYPEELRYVLYQEKSVYWITPEIAIWVYSQNGMQLL